MPAPPPSPPDGTFRSLLDAHPDAMAVVRDGKVAWANAALHRWLGHGDALLGASSEVLAHDLAALIEHPGVQHVQRFRKADGSEAVGHASASPCEWNGASAMLLAVRPASGTRRPPEMLRILEAAVDQVNDILFITEAEAIDGKGRRVLYVNDRFTQATGWSAEDVLGKTPNVTIGPATDRDALGRIESRLKENRPAHEELLKYKKDGSAYWVELDILPLHDEQGRLSNWISVQRDVTERKRLAAQLVESERLASLGTIAAGVAHEINNPLSAVIGSLDWFAEELPPLVSSSPRGEEIEAALRDATEGADRVRRIVRDMLIAARGDTEVRTRLDVRDPLESALRLAGKKSLARGRLVRELGDVPPVLANEGRLVQVFLNLLINAGQAIDERGEVRVTTRTCDGRAVVEIADDGHGIPPELRGRIFAPFFTTKPAGSGTGLGLFICHGIVTTLGGELEFESEVGVGTTFRVALPPAEGM